MTPARELLARNLEWIGLLESFDEESAASLLKGRLQAAGQRAESVLPVLDPWPSRPDNITRMLGRRSEKVRFDRVTSVLRSTDVVLDVGCAHGILGAMAARRSGLADYTGVDLVPELIDSAREMARANGLSDQLDFVVGDATGLDSSVLGSSPDVVLLLEILEHLKEPAQALSNIAATVGSAPIVLSVPMKGRIEACWGHHSLFGVQRLVGTIESAGLHLHHAEELHNTWILAVVSASSEPPALLERFWTAELPEALGSLTMSGVPIHRLDIGTGMGMVMEDPLRLSVIGRDEPARFEFDAPDAAVIRFEVACADADAIERIDIAALDGRGRVAAEWTTGGDRTGIRTSLTTLVLRPGHRSRGLEAVAHHPRREVARVRVEIVPRPGGVAEASVRRVAFAPDAAPAAAGFVASKAVEVTSEVAGQNGILAKLSSAARTSAVAGPASRLARKARSAAQQVRS